MFDREIIHGLYPEAEDLMYAPMLIWKLPKGKESMLSEVCSKGEYFLQEKLDGAFYQFVRTEHFSYLFGRTVSKTTGVLTEKGNRVPHIIDALSCLPPETIIIGEVYVPGGTSKTVTKYLGCLAEEAIKRQKEDGFVHYYVHDIIYYDGICLLKVGAEERYKILRAIYKLHHLDKYNFLHLAIKVDENLEEEISRILKSGGEGAVLKKRNAPYSPNLRPAHDTIKIKQMDSVDLVCMGFCPATKEYTGKEIENWWYWEDENGNLLGGYYYPTYEISRNIIPVTRPYFYGWPGAIEIGAYDDEGNLKLLGTVSSGLTDDDKRGMEDSPKDYIGRVVSLDCMSIDSKERTLRHPVFKSWRPDKNANECRISEIFK